MMDDSYILYPKALSGCICNDRSKMPFICNCKESEQRTSYIWDSGTKSFTYRFSRSNFLEKKSPYHNDRYVVLLEGRIDEIEGEIICESGQNITEKELVFFYQKYGYNLPNRIYGDWSFAIYDRKLLELFISRDHNGNSVMHYAKREDSFYFATLLSDILDNSPVKQVPNERRVADIHTDSSVEIKETCYQNIFRLSPGTSLLYTNGTLKLVPYWFPEDLPKLVYGNDTSYYDHFEELFIDAVKNRIRLSLRPAVALSGGLDSGAVASVAATILGESQRNLKTYTSIPAFKVQIHKENWIADEQSIIQSLLDRYENIDSVKFNSLDCSLIKTALRTMAIFREPVVAVDNYHWLFDLFERTENNNDTLLVGTMGNRTISWPTRGPIYDWNYLLICQIKKLYSLGFRKRNLLWRASQTSLLKASYIRQFGSPKNIIGNMYPYGILDVNSILHKTLRLRKNGVGAEMKTSSVEFNTNIFDPTNDRRLMEFVLRIPARIFANDTGSRLLVRKGLKGYLTKEYIENSFRGLQSSDISQKMRLQNEELLNELVRLRGNLALSKYFEFDKIDQIIFAIENNSFTERHSAKLLRNIATMNFFENLCK